MKTSVKVMFFISLFTGIFAFHNRTRESNTFEYKKNSYSIPNGYIEAFGMHPDKRSYDYDLHIASSTKAEFTETSSLDYIYLDLHSDNPEVISSGVYSYKEAQAKERDPFTFAGAEVLVNYDIDNKKGESLYATGGTVKVSQWKGKYVIEFHLELNNNERLDGIYKGELMLWEKSV